MWARPRAATTPGPGVLDEADAYSPVLDDFRRPLPVEREVKIVSSVT